VGQRHITILRKISYIYVHMKLISVQKQNAIICYLRGEDDGLGIVWNSSCAYLQKLQYNQVLIPLEFYLWIKENSKCTHIKHIHSSGVEGTRVNLQSQFDVVQLASVTCSCYACSLWQLMLIGICIGKIRGTWRNPYLILTYSWTSSIFHILCSHIWSNCSSEPYNILAYPSMRK
jgi:hypothetical protein